MQLGLLGLKKMCWGRVVALASEKYVCRRCITGYSFVFCNISRCFGFFSLTESRRFPLLCQKQGRAALRASGCALRHTQLGYAASQKHLMSPTYQAQLALEITSRNTSFFL